MANKSSSTVKEKSPRITKEQLKEIVEFYKACKDYDLTARTFEDKWKKEYHYGEEYRIKPEKLKSWIRLYEEDGNKLKARSFLPIYIFEILRKNSNSSHPMTEDDIKKIINDHEIFITKIDKDNRKLIPKIVNGLVDALPDLIVKKNTHRNKAAAWFYNENPSASYGLLTQSEENGNPTNIFSLEEASFFIDMVKDSRVISSECTSALIHKLVASMDNSEREQLRSIDPEDAIYKSENTTYLDYNEEIEQAKLYGKKVTISYRVNDEEEAKTVTPIKIGFNRTDKKYYLHAVDERLQYCSYPLEDITYLCRLKEKGAVIDGIDDSVAESEGYKRNKTIALDTLFFNTREINHAIAKSQYLTFSYLSYELTPQMIPDIVQSSEIKVIPFDTKYKNGKSYLLALDPKDGYRTVAYHIDRIQNIKSSGTIDVADAFYVRENHDNADDHPFMLMGFKNTTARFLIKADCLERVIDTFGLNVKFLDKKKAVEVFDGNLGKLARAFPKLDFDLGFDNDDILVAFEVNTTDEEAIRFALQNGDVVELLNPELRERVLHIAEAMEKRHTRSECDRERKVYQSVISGDEFLKLTSPDEPDKKALLRIEKEKAYDKVKKLHIGYSKEPIPVSELGMYTNVHEMVIEGTGVADFSWIKKLASLRRLTLTQTGIENGDVLAKIPQLDLLFLNGNYSLSDYSFLKNMKITNLYIGNNGRKADVSALYDLKYVNNLIIEENLLFDLDVERLENIRIEVDGRRRHMRVSRWIEGGSRDSKLPSVYDVNPQLFRTHKN